MDIKNINEYVKNIDDNVEVAVYMKLVDIEVEIEYDFNLLKIDQNIISVGNIGYKELSYIYKSAILTVGELKQHIKNSNDKKLYVRVNVESGDRCRKDIHIFTEYKCSIDDIKTVDGKVVLESGALII
ncbi:hypothetical protein SH1V18_48010 [Vallitalea longa]|uniref:Uncharacterized protein n=1 Tax=Vallitalea longa TaxID=2936439 RepID=A0A9W5YGC7_9FIRM|nr:hypothetical protein [Vallitalea longa]GKX32321.1 hypothetical protein SH1V18_48010 [Vallitalea longa]